MASSQLTAPHVRQLYYEVLEQDRVRAFVGLLTTQVNGGKALMFRRTKTGVDKLVLALQRQGVAAAGIHGGMGQAERNAAMRYFHAGGLKLLVATDVAARGLDIPQVSHVVSYDMPQSLEEYIAEQRAWDLTVQPSHLPQSGISQCWTSCWPVCRAN